MTSFKIVKNDAFNSIELYFDGIPSVEERNTLKALKFKWHSVKKCWYGYKSEEDTTKALQGKETKQETKKDTKKETKQEAVNKYGVKVGDLFVSSWGYEQTNVNFFQVVKVSSSMVRIVEVSPPIVEESCVCDGSRKIRVENTNELLTPKSKSIFIRNQVNGDSKKVQDGGYISIESFANAYKYNGEWKYESWYD